MTAPQGNPTTVATGDGALERAVLRAREDRQEQARWIDAELSELHRIYERMSNDLDAVRAERDGALALARQEREMRARETLALAERLEELERERQHTPAAGLASPEGFVRSRLDAAVDEHRTLEPGELPEVPGYRIEGPLGKGGMGTVWEAVAEADGRRVAIKLLQDGHGASRSRVELFLREAAAMLQLSHPGLVRALDAGDCAHGRFLVLELVRGESVADRVRRAGPLPEKDTVRLALQVARALSYCARLGLAHRDVKPSNLLLDEAGQARLCDFGLATLADGSDPARPYGSPGYAAPEQIARRTLTDERVDIYSLGCTLWHAAVGRRPFQGNPKQAFEQQKSQDLADPRFEGADVSPGFAQVIRRMGRADPDRRYRRWDECILDLLLVERGNPPFSAHIADALAAGGAARAAEIEAQSLAASARAAGGGVPAPRPDARARGARAGAGDRLPGGGGRGECGGCGTGFGTDFGTDFGTGFSTVCRTGFVTTACE